MAQLPSMPTGGSPLYLGEFAKPLYGITQNLTSAMIDQYERRKQEGDQDRAAILKALSFEAIENASDKASRSLLDEYSKVEDKWTNIYQQNGLRLSDAQRFELERDKRALDQKRATVKGNVEKAMLVQDLLTKYPDRFKKKSYRDWEQFTREGKIGLDDPFGVLSERPDVIGLAKKNFGTVLSNTRQLAEERSGYDPETGTVVVTKTNRPFIEEAKKAVFAHPEIREAISDPDDGKSDEYALNEFLDSFVVNDVPMRVSASSTERKAWEGKNLTPEQKKIKDRTGATVNPDIASMHERADILVSSAFAGDRGALDVFGEKGKARLMKDGRVSVQVKNGTKMRTVYLEPPLPEDSPEVALQKKAALANFLDKNTKGIGTLNPALFTPDLSSAKVTTPAKYAEIEDAQRMFEKNKGDKVKMNVGGTPTEYSAYSNDHVGVIKNELKKIFPEDTFSYPTFGYDFTWKSGDDTRTFNLKNEADRKKIQDLIEERGGRVESTPVVAPAEQQMEEREEGIKAAKQSVVDKAKTLNIRSVQDYKDLLVSAGKTEQEVDSIIEQLSLTDNDFR